MLFIIPLYSHGHVPNLYVSIFILWSTKREILNNLFTVIFHMTVMLHCKSSLHMFKLAYCVRLHHTQVPRVFSVSVIKPGMECQDECDFRDSALVKIVSEFAFLEQQLV